MHQFESRGQAMAGPLFLITLFGLEVGVDFKVALSSRGTSKSFGRATANKSLYEPAYLGCDDVIIGQHWLTQVTHGDPWQFKFGFNKLSGRGF